MMPLIKQSYRGILSVFLGLSLFTFLLLSLAGAFLTTTAPYEALFSDESALIAAQKERIDTAVDALAKKNRFEGEPVINSITKEGLSVYNIQLVSWWQNALATDAWTNAPLFDKDTLLASVENQEGLDERKKNSTTGFVQQIILGEVAHVSDTLILTVAGAVSTAPYLNKLPALKMIAIAAVALCLLLLVLSCLKQLSLLAWFLGLGAWLCGGLYIALRWLLQSFLIPENFTAYHPAFGQMVSGVFDTLSNNLCAIGYIAFIGGAAAMVAYGVIFGIIKKSKAVANA